MLRIRDPKPKNCPNSKKNRCALHAKLARPFATYDRNCNQRGILDRAQEYLHPVPSGQYVSSGSFSGQVTYLTTERTRSSIGDITHAQSEAWNLSGGVGDYPLLKTIKPDPSLSEELGFSGFQIDDFEYFDTHENISEMLTSQRRQRSVDGASFALNEDCFQEEVSAVEMSPAQDLRIGGKPGHEDREDLNDSCRSPFSDLSYDNNSESEADKTMNERLSENNNDDVTANDVGEDLSMKRCDRNLMQAKRARVENIVTNIRENPINSTSVDDVISCAANRSSPVSGAQHPTKSKRRRMDDKIRELQNEIEKIKYDYQNNPIDEELTTGKSMSLEMNEGKTIDNIVQDVRSPGRFISEALELVNQQQNDVNWPDKSPTRLPENNKDFRGEIKVTFPGGFGWNGENNEKMPAYEVLVDTLKRELSSAVEKIAEQSAKRVLEELELKCFNRQETWGNSSRVNSQKYKLKLKPSGSNPHSKTRQTEEGGNFNFDRQVGVTHVHTKSVSQMCFSDVQVRNDSFADSEDAKTSRNYKDHMKCENNPRSPESNRREQLRKINGNSPSSDRSNDDEVQTRPLPLVTKKSTSFSLPSSPELPITHRRSSPLHQPFIQNIPSKSRHNNRAPRPSPYDRKTMSPTRSGYSIPTYNPFVERPEAFPSTIVPNYNPTNFLSLRGPITSKINSMSQHMKPPPLVPIPFSVRSPFYPSHSPSTIGSYPFPFPIPNIGAIEKIRRGLDHLASKPTRTGSKSMGGSSSGNLRTDGYRNSPAEFSPCSMASIQEGLTPQHLKKAKLMFFFTRYPSANTLKTYFSDVKFSRAITSQLIKWFSNFREFYYIQMEKFSRQALTDGITQVEHLHVDRDSELFRVLNIHYNKSNDFRVPERFISVTETSLQEFFLAVQANKDRDPSWKKVIYKVICKLDEEVPEMFKSPNVLDHLDDMQV